MKFIDYTKIYVKAGDGGNGSASFRREKFVPKGGPDGGDGGNGGNIFIEVSEGLNTLLPFKFNREFKAKPGGYGSGARKHGKDGKDIVLKVPIGTIVRNSDTDTVLYDLTSVGEKILVVRGGDGGRGNVKFKSSTNQVPRYFEEGHPGESLNLILELKLIADVGLVGCPSSGKSTLISKISAAKSKAAEYLFTTLFPVLGVVDVGDSNSFVMADIPGLLEGAHKGVGLGEAFLSHIERTKILVFVLDASEANHSNPVEDFEILKKEIELYKKNILENKQKIIVLNKIDIKSQEKIDLFKSKYKHNIFEISAVTGEGCKKLINEIFKLILSTKEK
jgi:GTPase